MDFVLHCAVDEVRVGRRVGEDGGQERKALEVEDLFQGNNNGGSANCFAR